MTSEENILKRWENKEKRVSTIPHDKEFVMLEPEIE